MDRLMNTSAKLTFAREHKILLHFLFKVFVFNAEPVFYI